MLIASHVVPSLAQVYEVAKVVKAYLRRENLKSILKIRIISDSIFGIIDRVVHLNRPLIVSNPIKSRMERLSNHGTIISGIDVNDNVVITVKRMNNKNDDEDATNHYPKE